MRARSSPGRSSRLLEFLRTEEASGAYLLGAALIALVWANSPLRGSYTDLWTTNLTIHVGGIDLAMDLRHWVNEGLMTLFFLVVGLEIKREVASGELRDPRKLALPVLAALGGMVVPAAIYLLVNAGHGAPSGWGVPVATDIAFALGVLTLAASTAPVSLRSFLLTLAIVDDVGAIVLIAVFYSSDLAVGWLLLAVAIVGVVLLVRRLGVTSIVPFVGLGAALWLTLYGSGLHPTLAGVTMGLLAPAVPSRPRSDRWVPTRRIIHRAADRSNGDAEARWLAVGRIATSATSPVDRVETSLHPFTTRVVAPTFALANAGVELSGAALGEAVTGPIGLGIILGLVIGKPVGIGGAIWIARRTRVGVLPAGVTWTMLAGVTALAGVGFTVSLFIAELAFGVPHDVETAKLAVLLASAFASVLGALILRSANRSDG